MPSSRTIRSLIHLMLVGVPAEACHRAERPFARLRGV